VSESPKSRLLRLSAHAGIDLPNKEVIVEGRAGDPTAYPGFLAVPYFGGRSGQVYQGGIEEWNASGMTIATEPTRTRPAQAGAAGTRRGVDRRDRGDRLPGP